MNVKKENYQSPGIYVMPIFPEKSTLVTEFSMGGNVSGYEEEEKDDF